MSFLFSSLIGIWTGIPILSDLFTPDFWVQLYLTGTIAGKANALILIIVRLLVITLILVAARLLVSIIRRIVAHSITVAVSRTGNGKRRLTTLQGLLTSGLSYLTYFIALFLILFTLGVTSKVLIGLLSLASVLGVAIGFGSQRLVRDVITGMFILGEGQFDVGDWVTMGTVTGRVDDIGLRVTRLRDEEGRLYFIANGDITQLFNASRGMVRLAIEIAFQRSLPLEEGLLVIQHEAEEVLRQHQVTLSEEQAPVVMVVGMEAAKVTVRLVMWVPVVEKSRIDDMLRRRLLTVLSREESQLTLA